MESMLWNNMTLGVGDYRGEGVVVDAHTHLTPWNIVDFKSGKERVSEEYEEQLAFYKKVMMHKGLEISNVSLCWLGES